MIRIGLGPALINPRLSEQLKSTAISRFFIGDSGRNSQPNFCSSARLAPNIQLSSDSLCPFIDTGQSPMTSSPTIFQHCWIYPFSIISYDQKKSTRIVANLGLDVARACVAIGIAQQFSRNSVNLFGNHRPLGSSLALYNHPQRRGEVSILCGCQFATHCQQHLLEIAFLEWPRA